MVELTCSTARGFLTRRLTGAIDDRVRISPPIYLHLLFCYHFSRFKRFWFCHQDMVPFSNPGICSFSSMIAIPQWHKHDFQAPRLSNLCRLCEQNWEVQYADAHSLCNRHSFCTTDTVLCPFDYSFAHTPTFDTDCTSQHVRGREPVSLFQ